MFSHLAILIFNPDASSTSGAGGHGSTMTHIVPRVMLDRYISALFRDMDVGRGCGRGRGGRHACHRHFSCTMTLDLPSPRPPVCCMLYVPPTYIKLIHTYMGAQHALITPHFCLGKLGRAAGESGNYLPLRRGTYVLFSQMYVHSYN